MNILLDWWKRNLININESTLIYLDEMEDDSYNNVQLCEEADLGAVSCYVDILGHSMVFLIKTCDTLPVREYMDTPPWLMKDLLELTMLQILMADDEVMSHIDGLIRIIDL